MQFDYLTATALVDELNTKLAGGRIQNLVEIDDRALGFEVYANQQRQYLYINADIEQPRMHIASGKLRRGVMQPSPLGLLLKRRVVGGKLIAVRQPAWERIIILDILSGDHEFQLIFEPLERRANLALVEQDTIREVIRRVRPEDIRGRVLLPGQPYTPPAPQMKATPQDANLDLLLEAWHNANPDDKAFLSLVKSIHGISPMVGREIIYRVSGDPQSQIKDLAPKAVYNAAQPILKLLQDRTWQPGIITDEEGDPDAFAVYPVQYLGGTWQAVESVSNALIAYYGEVSGDLAYEAAKRPIKRQLKNALKKLNSKLFNLERQQQDDSQIERLKQSGELLLAYQFQIEPRQTSFSAQYDPDGEPIMIKLKPELTAVENANRYFEKYEKAKRGRSSLPQMIDQTKRDVRYIEHLETDLALASNWDDIGEVQDTLVKAGYWEGRKTRQTTNSGRSKPLKVTTDDGTLIWVGRNSRQNEDVTFKRSAPNDLWLHVRGMPGAHVVIKTMGRTVSEAVINYAAGLAAYYSKGRKEAAVDVLVTERKHVRSIKGGNPGQVRVMQQSLGTRRVAPRQPEFAE